MVRVFCKKIYGRRTHSFWSVPLVLLLVIFPAMSNAQVEEVFPRAVSPKEQWIVGIQRQRFRDFAAKAVLENGKLFVRSRTSEFDASGLSLLGALVELPNGDLLSTPLRDPEKDGVAKDSKTLAQKKRRNLEQSIGQEKEKVKTLVQAQNDETRALRSRAGLDDVIRIYERVAILEMQAAKMEDFLRRLDNPLE